MKFNLIVPAPALKPSGGVKVMYEYANQLSSLGHTVTIIHGIRQRYKQMKSPLWYKRLQFKIKGAHRPCWFTLCTKVKSVIVPEISDKYVPDADYTISTWWSTAFEVFDLHESKGKKVNLIQGYEIWNGNAELVHESYKLPVQHITVSSYLQQVVKEVAGYEPAVLPNAVNPEIFYTTVELSARKPASVCMLYSKQELKGSKYGMEALIKLKETFPDLTVDLIGVPKKPKDLPEWIKYNRNPKNLRDVYNRNSIFLSTSLNEGWGLTCNEAMLCGCSLVCTNIGGHLEFAIHDSNAILVEPANAQQIYDAISDLILDTEKRHKLANNGRDYILKNFSWQKSTAMLKYALSIR